MVRTSQPGGGFTLVEILIVVAILGILAAIVVPQFVPASEMTRANANRALLQTLRSQLELYKAHHGRYPGVDQLWGSLTGKTDVNGTVGPDGQYGPYLEREPINAFTGSTAVTAPNTGTVQHGWEYDAQTGEITAVGFNEATGEYTRP